MTTQQDAKGTKEPPAKPPPTFLGRMRRLAVRVLFGYLVICLVLTLLQRKLIYIPTQEKVLEPTVFALPHSRVEAKSFTGEDQIEVKGWLVSAKENAAKNIPPSERRAALVFQGNAYHRGGRGYLFDLFNSMGYDVFIFDYPGYGETTGSPSESAIVANALHQWQKITGEWGYQPGHVVLFGESLGGGVATQLAARACENGNGPGALILRSTFSSLVDAAGYHYPWLPVRLLLRDRYLSTDVIGQVTCPVQVIHGTEDRIVPYELGERLYAAAPEKSATGIPKEMLKLLGGDHNNVSHHITSPMGQGVQAFLEKVRNAE